MSEIASRLFGRTSEVRKGYENLKKKITRHTHTIPNLNWLRFGHIYTIEINRTIDIKNLRKRIIQTKAFLKKKNITHTEVHPLRDILVQNLKRKGVEGDVNLKMSREQRRSQGKHKGPIAGL